MTLKELKQAIADNKLLCPECKQPVKEYEKFTEIDEIWDGPGDSRIDASDRSKVTLTCTAAPCKWKERTEYWRNYIED